MKAKVNKNECNQKLNKGRTQWTQTHAKTDEKKLGKQIKIGKKQVNYGIPALKPQCSKYII